MKIIISELVYKKIMFWVNATDIEVSGFGKVIYDETLKNFTVTDAWLVAQKGQAAHTEINADALGKLAYDTRDITGDLNFWWHSHVKMSVFFSSQDTETIKQLGGNGYCVATVFNQRNEYHSGVCYRGESRFGALIHYADKVDTTIESSVDEALKVLWQQEFDSCVAREKPATVAQSSWYDYHKCHTRSYWPENDKAALAAEDNPQLDFSHGGDMTEFALLGYGSAVESQMLSINHAVYVNLLKNGSKKTLKKYKEKLIDLERKETRGLV